MKQLILSTADNTKFQLEWWNIDLMCVENRHEILQWCEEYSGRGRYMYNKFGLWLFILREEDAMMCSLGWGLKFKKKNLKDAWSIDHYPS